MKSLVSFLLFKLGLKQYAHFNGWDYIRI